MEEDSEKKQQELNASDFLGTVVRPPSIRVSGSFSSTLSERLTPRSSPSFRRTHSARTNLRDSRPSSSLHLGPLWYRKFLTRRLFPWLLIILLWSYIAFHLQSRWAHSDSGKDSIFGSQIHIHHQAAKKTLPAQKYPQDSQILHAFVPANNTALNKWTHNWPWAAHSSVRNAEQEAADATKESSDGIGDSADLISWSFPSVGVVNSSVGKLVGPFHDIERALFASMDRKTLPPCETESVLALFARGKTFLLVIHELSMTGAPLAMMELGSEILNCGGKVSAVVLSRKGGLLQEILARGIKVIRDKYVGSFRAATKVDVVVAGSALCASWLEHYLIYNKRGSRSIAWWIMENRREYFDRSKHMLSRVKLLIFLSEAQSKQWQAWSDMEHVVLPQKIGVVPLSVNDEISYKAGLKEPHEFISERKHLRNQVRMEMGLKPSDVLLLTLSSITPGKGQLMLLQSVLRATEGAKVLLENSNSSSVSEQTENQSVKLHKKEEEKGGRNLKLLIGSVGSKSNKIQYIKRMLDIIAENPCLAKCILWTNVTVHVAALYSAADVYVMNSQGIGETFGRVTIEAMAYGLPILGTDAGGTTEIVEHNVTGLLHPVGNDGVPILAQHINHVINDQSLREEMGIKGREKVKTMYMKELMYKRLGQYFTDNFEKDQTKRH